MLNESSVCDKEFYKVKFTEALDLVRSRKVFIYEGQCYVPIGNVQLFFTSWQFCTLDGVLINNYKKKGEFYKGKKKHEKILVKLCLRLGLHSTELLSFWRYFFHGEFQNFKIPLLAIFQLYSRHLTVILGYIVIKIDLSL